MAVLTWRNVDVPRGADGAILGLNTAANLLTNGTNGLADAIGNFGKQQTQLADNAAVQAASRFQDPNALKAALADGSLLGSLQGVDPSRVNAMTLGDIQNRVGTLINNATNQQSLDKATYDQNRTVQGNQLTDAAQPTVNKLLAASASGDPKQLAAAQAEAAQDPAYQALRSSQVNNVLTDSQALTGKQTQNNQSQFSLDVSKRTDADTQAGTNTGQMIAAAGYDNQGALQEINKLQSPGARQAAMDYLQRTQGFNFQNGPVGGAGPVAGGGGAGGGASSSGSTGFDTIYGNGKYGTPAAPITSMSTGDVVKFGNETLIPATKGKIGAKDAQGNDLGTSAVGAYQLTQGTITKYAPKVLGDNWQSQTFTPQAQDQIAKQLFEDNKGGDLHAIWPTLPDSSSGAYKNMSWEDIRPRIAQAESSTDRQTLLSQLQGNQVTNAIYQGGAQTRAAQDITNLGIDPKEWTTATNNAGSSADVAKGLSEGDGPLKGQNVNWVQNRIDDIIQKSIQPDPQSGKPVAKLNASQAGLVLKDSISGGSISPIGRGIDWATNLFTGNNLSSGQKVDQNKVDQLIKATATGSPIDLAGKTLVNQQTQQNLAGAQAAYQNAATAYSSMLARLQVGQPVDDATKARITANFRLTEANLKSMQGAQTGNPDVNPLGWKGAADAQVQQAVADAARKKAIDEAFNQSAGPSIIPALP
ncbi:hypothetical protein [Paraburkholderia sp. SIMBA_054]|uniref:hypothetical protein n=1 Tax=Paraburkholderia sp. SIMBA_054 TaxID=3085795 RepID=UPI00397D84D5